MALHDACRKNDTEMVKKILSDKIDVDCRNNVGNKTKIKHIRGGFTMYYLRFRSNSFMNL